MLSSLIAPLIEQDALNVAPGSTDSFPITTSPEIIAVALIVSVSCTSKSPENFPSISEFTASIFPFTEPETPIITRPFV